MSKEYEQYLDRYNRSVDAEAGEQSSIDKLLVAITTAGLASTVVLIRFIF